MLATIFMQFSQRCKQAGSSTMACIATIMQLFCCMQHTVTELLLEPTLVVTYRKLDWLFPAWFSSRDIHEQSQLPTPYAQLLSQQGHHVASLLSTAT